MPPVVLLQRAVRRHVDDVTTGSGCCDVIIGRLSVMPAQRLVVEYSSDIWRRERVAMSNDGCWHTSHVQHKDNIEKKMYGASNSC